MTEPAAPAPSPASTPVETSASDTAIFAKFTAQHQAAVSGELDKDGHADASKESRRGPAAVAAGAATAAPAGAARVSPRGEDAGAERDDGGSADDDAAPDADRAKADGADKEAATELSEADAIALARRAHAEGDTDALDRALKAILPGSKGLSEFAVDGKRYGELRAVTNRAQKKLDARGKELDTREANVSRGLAQVEQLVQRYQPIETLLRAAQGDDVDAFITLVEKATGKPINETVKRHLDKKLGKPGDPEVEALKRELRAEKDKREERERAEQLQREQAAHKDQIQRHLVFLDETLSKSDDSRVRALVKTPAGMRAIFEAQKANYNAQTRTTLSAEQAARFVLEQKQKELEPWQQVLGGSAQPTPNPATKSESGNQPAPSERVRALGNRGASPASGGAQRLNDTELFEKYERLAKLAGD